MTTHNDDAVREVTRKQRAERRNATRTPRNDKPTPADLTRELHLMETQVAEHGYPGTRAVLDLIGELRADLAKHRALLREVAHAPAASSIVHEDHVDHVDVGLERKT